jgi:hypothetical protein
MTSKRSTEFSFSCVGLVGLLFLTACGGGGATGGGGGGGGGGGSNITVSIASNSTFVDIFTSQQFTATVIGTNNQGVTWSVDNVNGGDATVGTISAAGLYTPPSTAGSHAIKATSVADTTKSASANLAVVAFGVYTFHNNLARDGANVHESALTLANVNTTTFGKLFSCPVDGATYTQPLWVPGLSIGGSAHNVIFVATEHDSAYAFDADGAGSPLACVQLWKTSLIPAGETSVPNTDVGAGFNDIQPEIGVTGTPVIDPASNTMYVVSKSEDSGGGAFHLRLHALSLLDGSEKFGGPVDITATSPGNGLGSSGGTLTFNPHTQHERAGLALANGVVYICFAAHEDADPYHAWVLGYRASNLAQASVYNATPNGTRGGIWLGGGAPPVDINGNLFVLTGNGTFSTADSNFGDSAIKLTSTLAFVDSFTPYNQDVLEMSDADFASSGLLLLPDQTTGTAHLLIAGSKEGRIYLIDRDAMGGFCSTCSTTDTNVVQSFFAQGNYGTPAFWQNALYFGGGDIGSGGDFVRLFPFTPGTGLATTSASRSPTRFPFPGAEPSVSSQGATNGIVWAIDAGKYGPPSALGTGPAVLHAYDATNLATELWNSSTAPGDQAGNAVKMVAPTIINGKVYLDTRTEIDVYGLLPP